MIIEFAGCHQTQANINNYEELTLARTITVDVISAIRNVCYTV